MRVAVVAPGKHRVIVFSRRTCFIIESPTSSIVGGDRGDAMGVQGCGGEVGCGGEQLVGGAAVCEVVWVGFCWDLRPGHSQVL